MSVSETVLDDEKKKNSVPYQNKESVRFRGKDIDISKLIKKVSHKPRLLGPVLINLSIILAIIGHHPDIVLYVRVIAL